jgi:hypothetical protein
MLMRFAILKIKIHGNIKSEPRLEVMIAKIYLRHSNAEKFTNFLKMTVSLSCQCQSKLEK